MPERLITRRNVLLGGAAIFTAGAAAGTEAGRRIERSRIKKGAYDGYQAYLAQALDPNTEDNEADFPTPDRKEVLDYRFSSLEHVQTPLVLSGDEKNEQHATFMSGMVNPYGIRIDGAYDSSISLLPLQVVVNDEKYIAPLIQSGEFSSVVVFVGDLGGLQDVSISTLDDSPLPPGLSVSATELKTKDNADGEFTREILRNTPKIAIRKDNVDRVTNDIPLSMGINSYYNSLDERIVEYFGRYSAESNLHAPFPLGNEVGRTWDSDTVSLVKFSPGMEVVQIAHMDKAHVIVVDSHFDEPEKLQLGERWEYQVVEDNNMVSADIAEDSFFAFLPDNLLFLSARELNSREQAVEAISLREYIREGRLTADSWYVQRFNAQYGEDIVGLNLESRPLRT